MPVRASPEAHLRTARRAVSWAEEVLSEMAVPGRSNQCNSLQSLMALGSVHFGCGTCGSTSIDLPGTAISLRTSSVRCKCPTSRPQVSFRTRVDRYSADVRSLGWEGRKENGFDGEGGLSLRELERGISFVGRKWHSVAPIMKRWVQRCTVIEVWGVRGIAGMNL